MSSCSKEDALTPQPESASLKDDANMRSGGETGGTTIGGTAGGTINPNTFIQYTYPTTLYQSGKGVFPYGWGSSYMEYGSSNTEYLGNKEGRWLTQFAQPEPGVETFVTGKNTKDHNGSVFTTLKNLKRGNRYRLTFYVSTSSVQPSDLPSSLGIGTPNAAGVMLWVSTKETNPELAGYGKAPYTWNKGVSFLGRANQWIKETIEFNALSDTSIKIDGYHPNGEVKDSYFNVSIGKYAIEDLGPAGSSSWKNN
ncbi:hypothetical protein GCM10011325_17930 [Dyadobacter sediminis]|nr:hypothetical protein GCM10011325_17930 [Dyadobacter sediminis]